MTQKILVIVPTLHKGGAELQAKYFTELLLKKGYKITIGFVENKSSEKLVRESIWQEIISDIKINFYKRINPVHSIKWKRSIIRLVKDFLLIPYYNILKKVYYRKWDKEKYEFIVPFIDSYGLISHEYVLNSKLTKHIWLNLGSLPIFKPAQKAATLRITERIFFCANSMVGKEELVTLFNLRDNKVYLIRNFISQKKTNYKSIFDGDKKILLHIGNFMPAKDYKTLWSAISQLKMITDNFRLIVLGYFPPTSNQQKVEKELEELGLISHVELYQNKDPGPFLKIADIGILSTRREGASNAILEYLQYNLPIITTDINPNKEILTYYPEDAFFIPGDHQKLTDQILKLITNPDYTSEIKKLSYRCFEDYLSRPSWEHLIENVFLKRKQDD